MNAPSHLQVVGSASHPDHRSKPSAIPPHNLDAEAAVLAAVLLDPTALRIARTILEPVHFYSESHRRILEAAIAVDAAGASVDVVTVGAWLKEQGRLAQVGGMAYLTEILNASPAISHLRSHAAIVFERARCRQVIAACEVIQACGYLEASSDVQTYIDDAVTTLTTIARDQPGRPAETNLAILRRMMTEIQAIAAGKGTLAQTGIPSGFTEFDAILGGLHAAAKVTIAALSGCGKTTIALQIARNVAESGIGVLYFSAEQTQEELLTKLLSRGAGVPFMSIRKGDMTPREWTALTADAVKVSGLPLAFHARPGDLNVQEIRAAALRRADETSSKVPPLGLVVVDHLHRLSPVPGREREEKHVTVAHATKSLKQLARELKIPVLELAQQREREVKPGHELPRPGENDIAWSQDVRREADALVYLHRPNPKADRVVAIFSKVRFGATADVEMQLEGRYSRFRAAGQEFEP